MISLKYGSIAELTEAYKLDDTQRRSFNSKRCDEVYNSFVHLIYDANHVSDDQETKLGIFCRCNSLANIILKNNEFATFKKKQEFAIELNDILRRIVKLSTDLASKYEEKKKLRAMPGVLDIKEALPVRSDLSSEIVMDSTARPGSQPQIRLANTQNDCFVNAAVWCILHSSMLEHLSGGDLGNKICKELGTLLYCNLTIQQSTHRLRRQFPQFDDGRQHDVCELLDSLLQQLPPSLGGRCKIPRKRFRRCTICDRATHVHDVADYVQRPRPLAGLRFAFVDMMATLFADHHEPWACVRCNARTEHEIRHELNTDVCDMMVVQLPLDDGHGRRVEYEFTGRRRPMLFNGDRWDMRCAVGHRGDSMANGHYVAWLKHEDRNWILMDDQLREPITKQRFPMYDKMIRCMIFEKIRNL